MAGSSAWPACSRANANSASTPARRSPSAGERKVRARFPAKRSASRGQPGNSPAKIIGRRTVFAISMTVERSIVRLSPPTGRAVRVGSPVEPPTPSLDDCDRRAPARFGADRRDVQSRHAQQFKPLRQRQSLGGRQRHAQPVNEPGPIATATAVRSRGVAFARRIRPAMAGISSSVCRLAENQFCSASRPRPGS